MNLVGPRDAYEYFKGHSLVYGQTGAGKSSFLKYVHADEAVVEGFPVVVYDPFKDDGWPDGCWVTDSQAKFFERADKVRNAKLLFDEAGDGAKRNVPLEKLAIQARHLGHSCDFSAQRPQQISTTIRGQASNLITFHLVPKDAEFLAEEFGDDILLEAQNLEPLDYIWIDRWHRHYFSVIEFPSK